MYREDTNAITAGLTAMGMAFAIYGALSMNLWSIAAGGSLLVAVCCFSLWIGLRGSVAMRRARRAGWHILVPMRCGRVTSWLVLRSRGIRRVEPTTEYHLQVRSATRAVAMRQVLHDLRRLSATAPAPSLHLFSWRGIPPAEVQRLLSHVATAEDRMWLWRHRNATVGVVQRLEAE